MFVNLYRGGKMGQYFTEPFADLKDDVEWLRGYAGFTTRIGRITNADGDELGADDVININTAVSLYPTKRFKLKSGYADMVPSSFLMGLGNLIFRHRINASKGDEVHVVCRVNRKIRVADILGQELCDVYVLEEY